MKKIIIFLQLLFVFSGYSQDTKTVQAFQNIVTPEKINGISPQHTISQLRQKSLSVSDASKLYYCNEKGKEGYWYFDTSDTVSADNLGTVLVTTNKKRLKRFIEGKYIHPEWFGAFGDGNTDDYTALQNCLNLQKPVFLEKSYLTRPLTVYNEISGTGSLKQKANTNSAMITIGADNVIIKGLTLDYNKDNNSTNALAKSCIYGLQKNNIRIENCTIKNSVRNGIYLKKCNTITITKNYFENINGEVIFLHGGNNNSIISENQIYRCSDDGIKIHSHDGQDLTLISKNHKISKNIIDYSSVFIDSDILGIEIWRGDNFNNSVSADDLIEGNTVVGSKVVSNNVPSLSIWGISLDNTDNSTVVSNNCYGNLRMGYEAAGCRNIVFESNNAANFDKAYSISKLRSYNINIKGGIVRNANSITNIYAIQVVDNAQFINVDGVSFSDFGERGVFFNGGGSGGSIKNNNFSISSQQGNATCIYTYNVTFVSVLNNSGNPDVVSQLSSFGLIGARLQETRNFVFSGNQFDGRKADAINSVLGTSCVTFTGNTGRGTVIGNNISGYSGAGLDASTSTSSDIIQFNDNYFYNMSLAGGYYQKVRNIDKISNINSSVKTANFDISDKDSILYFDASLGSYTQSLPSPSLNINRVLTFCKKDATSNTITFSNLNTTNVVLRNQYDVVSVISDGNAYNILNSSLKKQEGSVTLVSGNFFVANSSVTANSNILLNCTSVGGTQGILSYVINVGVGFTIHSSSSSDTSIVKWIIL